LDPGYPINYKVPDHGEDRDVIGTANSIDTAEKIVGKKMKLPEPEKKPAANAKVQLESDPICTGPGAEHCDKVTRTAGYFGRDCNWPRDYKVANHGEDHDVIGTASSLNDAERITG
jgi:hypothetical protein